MRHQLPQTRNRRLAALIALAFLVAATSIGMAHADTDVPAQAQIQAR